MKLMNRESVIRLQPVFALLQESSELARRCHTNLWQCSVAIGQLYSLGATDRDLQQLVASGLTQHGRETTGADSTDERTFASADNGFGPKSCFVLAPAGVEVMKDTGIEKRRVNGLIDLRPIWNTCNNELRIAGQLVKRFKWRAPNQERLIMAFEEQGWPTRIADPLEKDEMVDPKRRLHDTIKCLNRRHVRDLMRFHGDGTGQGVEWRVFDPTAKNQLNLPR